MVDEQNVCREVKYRQIAVTHRLVDVNESRLIRCCWVVSVCFRDSAFLNFFPPWFLLFYFLLFSIHQSISLLAILSFRGISGRLSLE